MGIRDRSARRLTPGAKTGVAAGVLALWVCLVFGSSLTHSWTNWDDYEFIIANPQVRHPLERGFWALLRTQRLGYPAPVTTLSQALDWWLGGGKAWAFHGTNLLLHTLNGVLVHTLLRQLRITPALALWGAALFLAHPIVVEPVAWATGRKDLLATAFSLAAIVTFLPDQFRLRSGWSRAISVSLLGLLALGSKPSGVVLAPLLLLLGWYKPPAAGLATQRRWPTWRLFSVGLTAVGAGFVAVLAHRDSATIGALAEHSLTGRLALVPQYLALALRNLVWPGRLSAIYFEPFPFSFPSGWAIASGSVSVLLTGLVFWSKRSARGVFVGLCWFLISFAPVSGMVPMVRGPADSYLYLPWIGLVIALCQAVRQCSVKFRRRAPRLGRGLALTGWGLLPLLVLAIASANYVAVWSSSSALWQRVVNVYPEQASAHQNLGDALLLEGNAPQAVVHLEQAVRLSDTAPEDAARLTLARACVSLRRERCAFEQLAVLAESHPNDLVIALSVVGASRFVGNGEHSAFVATAIPRARRALLALHGSQETELRNVFVPDLTGDSLAFAGLEYFSDEPRLSDVVQRLRRLAASGHFSRAPPPANP